MNSQSVSVTFPISFFNSCLNVIGVASNFKLDVLITANTLLVKETGYLIVPPLLG